MVCFGKQHYFMNVFWSEQLGKNSLTAVMFEWDFPLHIPRLFPPYPAI